MTPLTLNLLALRALQYAKYSARMKPEELKDIRKNKLKLTQEQLAAELGVAPNTVARWESGVLPIQKVVELAIRYLVLR
jgi:DNA-binding transcriptional regulator YiaG